MPADHSKDTVIDEVLGQVSDLTPRVAPDLLRLFIDELVSWNPQLGLISKQDTPRVIARLLRQSAALWDFVVENAGSDQSAARVVDIGSGGGFPGVVWKLLAPNLKIVLLERKGRRAFFLERLAFRLNLEGIEVVHGDLREMSRQENHRGAYGIATVMAVTPPERLAAAVEPLLASRGIFCCIRGSKREVSEAVGEGLALAARATVDDAHYLLYRRS